MNQSSGLAYAKTVKKNTKSTVKEDEDYESDEYFEDSTIIDFYNPMQIQAFGKEEKVTLMFMYHEDDDASVEALVEFQKTEAKLRGYAHFVTIGCHKEGFSEIMPACKQELNAGIFPLISAMVPPFRRANPYTKKIEDNTEVPYGNRARTSKSMIKFLQSNIPNFTELIKSGKDYDDKIVNSNKRINKVVLFSDKLDKSLQPPTMYKALATHFKETLDFYLVDLQKLKKRVKNLGITEYPTILVYTQYDKEGELLDDEHNTLNNLMLSAKEGTYEVNENDKIVKFTGDVDMQELIEFLSALNLQSKYDPDQKSKANEERVSKYTIVNHRNYTKGFVDDYRTQIVFFDTSFDRIKDTFDYVAQELHGPTNVVFFDCNTEETKQIAKEKYEITKFPKLLVFGAGAGRSVENALEISHNIDPDDLVGLIVETEIKDNLKDVSDSMIGTIILTNAMQLRKITLVYLYTDDDYNGEIPLSFKSVSMHPKLKEHFDFVAIKNPGQMTLNQFQVKKLPIIIGGLPVPKGSEGGINSNEGSSIQTMFYQGDVNNYYDLLSYNLGVVSMFYPDESESEKPTSKPPAETIQFQEMTASNIEDIWESRKGLWAIALLPANIDNEYSMSAHFEYLEILEERNKESSGQFKYMWMNASCHDYALLNFDLNSMSIPTLVIYSPSQQKYAKMINSFSKENIEDFEKSFEGTGSTRVSIYDSRVKFGDTIRDIDWPNLMPDIDDEFIMSEEDEEILKELMEEERLKVEELEKENKSSKKKGKGKKKNKK